MAIPSSHWEHFYEVTSTALFDPLRGAICYLFPECGAWFDGYREILNDPSLNEMMPEAQRQRIYTEINLLVQAADSPTTRPFVALANRYANWGSILSLRSPAVLIPHQHLFPDFHPDAQFFIARELHAIKENHSLVRLVCKVLIAAAIALLYAFGASFLISAAIITALGIAYIITERTLNGAADLGALSILQKRGIENPKELALAALERQRTENQKIYQEYTLCKIYMSENGNNHADLFRPALLNRISNIADYSLI